ncbi:MAG: hypothetical protein V2I67_18225 [Thermoanaerobaculales bacterium]|nr:hypothetical protein [Thermoanaerobaculales bacterium]
MKRTVLVISVAVLAVVMSNPVAAQNASDETKLTYEVLTEEWGTLIGGALDLTEAEAEAFWPVYKEYGKAKREVWNRRIDVIKIFMGSYNDMSPEMSRILLDQTFNIAKDKLELEMKYAEIFDDFLPPEKVTRLFQAENKLETTLMMQIVKDVPLAK